MTAAQLNMTAAKTIDDLCQRIEQAGLGHHTQALLGVASAAIGLTPSRMDDDGPLGWIRKTWRRAASTGSMASWKACKKMSNTQAVTFPAANGGPLLRGILHPASLNPCGYAVVCHPHPQMGGTMDDAIVVAVCRALAAHDWTALRFDFRRAFDGGRGEM